MTETMAVLARPAIEVGEFVAVCVGCKFAEGCEGFGTRNALVCADILEGHEEKPLSSERRWKREPAVWWAGDLGGV